MRDKDKLKESSLDCHESMEVYKQGTKERDLHEDDLYGGIRRRKRANPNQCT